MRCFRGPTALTLLGLIGSCTAASFSHTVGKYTVSWSDQSGLKIRSGAQSFSTAPGTPFLSTGCGQWSATEHEGNFHIVNRPANRTTNQTVLSSTTGTGFQPCKVDGDCATTSYCENDSTKTAPFSCHGPTQWLKVQGELLYDTPHPGCAPANYTLAVVALGEQLRLSAEVKPSPKGNESLPDRVLLAWAAPSDEAYRGFGHQYSRWNLRGEMVPIWTQEQGVGRGLQPLTALLNTFDGGAGGSWDTTYSAVPIFVTSHLRGMIVENTEYTLFDLRSSSCAQASVQSLSAAVRLGFADTPLNLIESLSWYTGRMQALPDWTSTGAVVGYEGGTAKVREMWDLLREAGVPIAAFWVQDWSGVRVDSFGTRVEWNWEHSEAQYPDWDQLIADLAAANATMLTYINPCLSASTVPASQHNLFAEAAGLGYLVKNSSGDPYIQVSGSVNFTFGTIDLTNPEAAGWYQQLIQCNMLRVGQGCGARNSTGALGGGVVSQRGWMADFGEYLPTDAVLHAGDPAAVHNLYPEMWATANRRAIRDAGMEGQVAFFSRSASARSPGQATLFWMGDQLVTYDSCDGMQSALMGMLSGGLCGLSMSHSDIGGYTMVHAALKGHQFEYLRTQELLLRWMEFSAFSDALFRSHVGNLPNQSAQVYSSNQTLAHFASFARVHSALGPYRRALMQEAASAGAPLTRHPWLHYPADSTASELSAQFMMGEHLMVAPVFQPNASMVKVYLPDPLQRWQHWSNSTEYPGGGWYEVAAPVGSPAVFATTEFAAGDVWRAVCSVLRELNHADPQAQAEEWIA